MADIQSPTAEIRRGNKKDRKQKPQDENIYVRILLCRAAINYWKQHLIDAMLTNNYAFLLNALLSFKIVNTLRVKARYTLPVSTVCVYGPCPRTWTRVLVCPKYRPCSRAVLDTLVTNTAREYGRHFGYPCSRAVDTGSVYRT